MTRTILIVEDEADLAATCARVLRRHGWQVAMAGTRDAGVAMVGRARPALAIVDRWLPDGDGLDVLQAAHTHGTPVIMVTGYTSAAARRQALDEGAAGFLGKPFSTRALLDLVDAIAGPPPPIAH
jgi:DNA-binding response OmpR family regulator